jgi:hypothetical protein
VDLIQFLFYAKGSAGEVRSQLWNAEDVGYITPEEGKRLREMAADVSRQLKRWIDSMQAADFAPGPKYQKRPARAATAWEEKMAEMGLMRTPDGRYVEVPKDGNKE